MKGSEKIRLFEAWENKNPWLLWGPYLSERQWGTVREDYSKEGDAWHYFTHDQARSRAYKWGEDGIAGISDDKQLLCFAPAFWNGKDPILKERLFGLDNSEGNHGEDVKEYYYYLDNTPTHSYMKYLYKYPSSAYPYDDIVITNRNRSKKEPEYELIDTGIFSDNKYFDIFIEYAKKSPDTILIRITACNRGTEEARLDILPTLWFRNTWSWVSGNYKPKLYRNNSSEKEQSVIAFHPDIGMYKLSAHDNPSLLFTENETNNQRIFDLPNIQAYVKDAYHEYLIHNRKETVNSDEIGTKVAFWYSFVISGGGEKTIKLCLEKISEPYSDKLSKEENSFISFDKIFSDRIIEADSFYSDLTPGVVSEDLKMVMRQALAGMLWSKQYYYFDLDQWLREHGNHPLLPEKHQAGRNNNWYHMVNNHIISMPDKWAYPWYAAWDLAFHTIPLMMVDPVFARGQLELMFNEVYMHPSGQVPAYEWNFGDVNPPVHAWATMMIYKTISNICPDSGIPFLKEIFHKLLLNFTWWVNRRDPAGRNIFDGGFLGLDNIGVFDRSSQLPTGGFLEQSDGTAWMVFYCQNMLSLSLLLAEKDPSYESMVVKFFEHYMWIAASMDRIGENSDELWDEEDGFFYDVLHFPDGSASRIKVRSVVGLLPLCSATILERSTLEKFPEGIKRIQKFLVKYPDLKANISVPDKPGIQGRFLLSVLNDDKLRRILARMLDEDWFFSPYGIRSLSRWHKDNPYVFSWGGIDYTVAYEPGESQSNLFGGNSNWRGPVWLPINILIIRAILSYYLYYGDEFMVECPTGSGNMKTLFEVAKELTHRLLSIFKQNNDGSRIVFGNSGKFKSDIHWKDNVLFYEYFHGDSGAGLGASHQTGWTGTVAYLIHLLGHLDQETFLKEGILSIYKNSSSE